MPFLHSIQGASSGGELPFGEFLFGLTIRQLLESRH